MFVLFNKKLNRYFKHKCSNGIWWTNSNSEANEMLANIKKVVEDSGYPELSDHLVLMKINKSIIDCDH